LLLTVLLSSGGPSAASVCLHALSQALLEADPFDPDVQRRIEELIQKQNIEENLAAVSSSSSSRVKWALHRWHWWRQRSLWQQALDQHDPHHFKSTHTTLTEMFKIS